ncbi:MAG TPA: tripartite tricarboxylate transporter TctB family protein [Atribacterota bacterium]|nr:tripartite tricarboxylate transporter TctB family protein [Atribacterota bacterium]
MTKKKILEKINPTTLLSIILIIANSIYFIEGIRTAPLIKNDEIGITFFPFFVSLLLFITAGCLLYTGMREKTSTSFSLFKISRPIVIIVTTLIYVAIFKKVGYFLSSILYVFSLMLLFDDQKDLKNKKLLNIIFTIGIVLIIYLLYQKVFGVRLPIGEVFL